MKTIKIIHLVLICILIIPAYAFPANDITREEINQMKKEIQELKGLVGDLKSVIKEQKQTIENLSEAQRKQDADAAVREHAGADEEAKQEGRKVAHTLEDMVKSIKPAISVTGDFVASLADDSYMNDDDRFNLRGVDIDFSGDIDNVAHAYFNLSYHDDDVDLEEGYLDIYKLLPGKTDLRLGKFRVNFGLLNTIHPHALPQVDYPAVYRAYLGDEGYIDQGVGIAGAFPSPWKSPFHYTLQAVNGNRHDHNDENDKHDYEDDDDDNRHLKDFDDIVYVGRLWNEIKRSDDFGVKWGFSGLTGRFEDSSSSPRYYLEGIDLSFTWFRCPEKSNRVRWQSEVFFFQVDNGSRENAYGLYSFLDYAFATRWLAGVRYDYAQLPLDSDDNITEYSAYLTHQFSKNIKIRLQYEHQDSNYMKDSDYVWLQWVFTLGRHTHLEEESHGD